MTTTVTTTAFFPSLRERIDEGRDLLGRNDDWLLLDEILFETSVSGSSFSHLAAELEGERERPPMPTQFPSLKSLGLGSGSNSDLTGNGVSVRRNEETGNGV